MEIKVLENILGTNDSLADDNARLVKEKGVFVVNLMASPGAGKTTFILETIARLRDSYSIAVIEGDIASQVDADKIRAQGVPSVQINTGGACHLEANMIQKALGHIDLDDTDLIIIENVGNLVCPAEFKLGEDLKVMILSIPEGDDKPLKYPLIFSEVDGLVLSKMDTLPAFDFSMERLYEVVAKLNRDVEIMPLSCKSGEGVDAWIGWLRSRIEVKRG
ncbi:MAG: hydrogenase nickel incorporation protein HypB [Candidatus Aquicultorales bacterium]